MVSESGARQALQACAAYFDLVADPYLPSDRHLPEISDMQRMVADGLAALDAERAKSPVACSYCSFEVAGPVEASVVQNHVVNDCEFHPMRELERRLEAKRAARAEDRARLDLARESLMKIIGLVEDFASHSTVLADIYSLARKTMSDLKAVQ